ncbi:MAG: phytanoyl-CoA dioxygenase family protein [Pseudomonadota bacterium]
MTTQSVVSAVEKQTFDEDGVVCLRGVLDPQEIGMLRSVLARQLRDHGQSKTSYDLESIARQVWDGNSSIDVGKADRFDVDGLAAVIQSDDEARPLFEDDNHEDEGLFLYKVGDWRNHRGIRRVGFDSKIPQIVAELLDTETLNWWEDSTFVKAPHTRLKTPFHQDLTYFQISGDQSVIVWIPLDPSDLSNGVTRYVRGSHKSGETYAPNMFLSQTVFPGSEDPKCPDIEADESQYDIISFDVEPGDVIIHHVRTIHGAGGNTTDKPRRAISFRYTGDNVRYFDKPGALPQTDTISDLKNGDRLHSLDYPIVWPTPWPGVSISDLYDMLISSREPFDNEKVEAA